VAFDGDGFALKSKTNSDLFLYPQLKMLIEQNISLVRLRK